MLCFSGLSLKLLNALLISVLCSIWTIYHPLIVRKSLIYLFGVLAAYALQLGLENTTNFYIGDRFFAP